MTKSFFKVAMVSIMMGISFNLNAAQADVEFIPIFEGGDSNGNTKSPVQVPIGSIDDHTLYIDGIGADYTLELIDENDTVVYSTYVPSSVNVVVLPSTLSGNFELRLYPGGSYYFYGYISL